MLRCVYAYFMDLPQEDLPYVDLYLHRVLKLTNTAYGCEAETFDLSVDSIDQVKDQKLT